MHEIRGVRGKCTSLVFAMLLSVAPEKTTVESSAPAMKRGRLRRAFGTILATLGLTSVFACSVLVSLGLHVNLPPLRRIARHAVNQVLANALEGKIVIDDIKQIHLDAIAINSVVAFDPAGRQTLAASGITAYIDTRRLVREFQKGNLLVSIPLLRIDDVDVLLDRDAAGRLGIQQTFTPKPSKPPKKPQKPKAKKGDTFILLPDIDVAHVHAHGNITGPRNLDADATRIDASVRVDPDKLEVDVDSMIVNERALLPGDIAGRVDYHLHVDVPPANTPPAPPVQPLPRMSTSFAGRVGSIEVGIQASLDGKDVAVSLDLPQAEASDVTKLVPDVPITQRTALHATINGSLPTLTIDGQLDLTPRLNIWGFESPSALYAPNPTQGLPAQILLAGKLDLKDGANVIVDVTTKNVDARAFREDLPATKVNARAHVVFAATPAPRFVAEATVEPTKVADQSIPAIEAHAAFDHGILEGRVTLHEPGAPTHGVVVLEGREVIRFETETSVASLQGISRIRVPASGSGRVRIRGAVRGKELDAHVEGNVHAFAVDSSFSLDDARIDGRVQGPFDHLEMNASVTGDHLRAGENTADKVTVRATGPILSPLVDAHLQGGDVEDLRVRALIDPPSKAARNVKVHLARGGEELHGQVVEVRGGKGSVAVRGVALEGSGLGSLGGTLVVANQDITGKLAGKNIDLERMSRLLGLGKRTRGVADVDIAIARTNHGRKGHVDVQIKNATMAPMAGIEFPGTSAMVKATFDDERAALEASLRIEDHAKPGEDPATACEGTIAEVRISEAEGALRGPLLAPSTWTKLSGRARVDARDTRLDCIARRLPLALLLTEISGRLDASISVERPQGQRFVSVKDLEVRTRGLKIAGPQMFGEDKPRWESRSLDVAVTGSIDGSTGSTNAKLALSDDKVVAELATDMKLDLATLVDDPKRRLSSLANSEGTVTFSIPRRSFESLKCLPSVVHDKLPPFEGDFAVTVTGKGTVLDPSIGARVSAWRFAHVNTNREPSEWYLPVDVDVVANYKAKKAGVVTQVRRNTREIASIVGNAEIDLQTLVRGIEYTPNFDVQTTLTRLPLGRIPFFNARGVNGQLSGTFQLGQHGDQRTAKARLILPNVRINDELSLDRVALALDITPSTDAIGTSHGSFQVELSGKEGGSIDVAAYAGMDWSEFTPKIHDDKPAGLSIRAHEFELASLQPLVNGAISRIGGKLDGELNVASTMFGDESRGYVESNIRLQHGVVHIPQIGQELKNAQFVLRSRERGSLHFDDFQAEGISGRIKASAVAKMKGLSFQSATANLSIAKSESLPITFEGVPLGHAYGKIAINAAKKPHEMDIGVNVSELHLALPTSSSRNVQSLDPHPDIAISHPIGPKKELRQSDAMTVITTIEIGKAHIEGMGVDIKLTSPKDAPPRIELREDARLSGAIQVTSGTFEVIGKTFEIERGLVRLREEEAGNPYVNITARWDAPDGARVYVDYAGVLKPISSEKLRFRSDPPLSQQAILAMILSGGSSESTGDASEQGAVKSGDLAANMVGGEIASTQINAVLSQIAPLRGLSTRLGTSDSGRLRTTVMYELSDTVKAQASYEGIPNGSRLEGIPTNPSDAAGGANRTEINIDWRFYKNWSLRGTFGFGGQNQQPSSGLDVLWQYRY